MTPMAAEVQEILDACCVTQELLGFVAGVDPDTITRIVHGRACSAATRFRLRWAAGLLRQVTDPGQSDTQVAQIIDWLGDEPARVEAVQARKAFLRRLRQMVRSGQPPVSVWREWRADSDAVAA